MSDRRRYSSDGPICPHCGREYVPDEPSWFQDHEMDCVECGKAFQVTVDHSTSWTTHA